MSGNEILEGTDGVGARRLVTGGAAPIAEGVIRPVPVAGASAPGPLGGD